MRIDKWNVIVCGCAHWNVVNAITSCHWSLHWVFSTSVNCASSIKYNRKTYREILFPKQTAKPSFGLRRIPNFRGTNDQEWLTINNCRQQSLCTLSSNCHKLFTFIHCCLQSLCTLSSSCHRIFYLYTLSPSRIFYLYTRWEQQRSFKSFKTYTLAQLEWQLAEQ